MLLIEKKLGYRNGDDFKGGSTTSAKPNQAINWFSSELQLLHFSNFSGRIR